MTVGVISSLWTTCPGAGAGEALATIDGSGAEGAVVAVGHGATACCEVLVPDAAVCHRQIMLAARTQRGDLLTHADPDLAEEGGMRCE
jgi:hypothetical protein